MLFLSLVSFCKDTCVKVLLSVSVSDVREGYKDGTHAEICAPAACEGSLRQVGCLGRFRFNCECILDAFLNTEGLTF